MSNNNVKYISKNEKLALYANLMLIYVKYINNNENLTLYLNLQ